MRQEVRGVSLSGPYLGEREEELVLEVMRSGRLSLGPTIDRFEELLAERVGAPYAAAVSSGTAGLHLLCISAGIGSGDEVVTTPYSFAATANCFVYEGGVPVFADVDRRTLNIDPAAVEAAVTPRTKAIVAVDIYGYPCELDALQRIADRHGLGLIQDSCEALGAEYRGAPLGSHGPACVFAFYPNKQITTGEGGLVVTDDEGAAGLMRALRNQGRAPGDTWLQPRLSLGVSPDFSSGTCHSTAPLSASKAYTLSCSVATYSTLWVTPLMLKDDTYKGCASTLPSTG